MKLFWVVVLLCSGVMAQCPMQFERVRAADSVRTAYGNYHYYFRLKWKNASDKEIVGAVFQPFTYDAMREAHDLPETWQSEHKVKAGSSKNESWDATGLYEYGALNSKYAGIRLVSVLYADGTKWDNDGSEQCVGKTPSVNW